MSPLQSLNVEGIELSFVEKGAGQTIFFVHGIPTDYRAWAAQVTAFSESFQTVSYSRRCAYPNKNKDLASSTVENNAKDLAALIRSVTEGPVHLVGHSYGGFVAAYCAFLHPELARSLVLVVPYIPTLLIKNLDSSADKLSLLIRMPSVALSAQKLLNSAVYPALKELDQGNGEKAIRIHIDGLQEKQNAFDQFPEGVKSMLLDNKETIRELSTKLPVFTKKEARTIGTPTLLIRGENCPKALSAVVELLAENMPHSQLSTVSNSAHFPHFENPEEFNSKLSGFLSNQTK